MTTDPGVVRVYSGVVCVFGRVRVFARMCAAPRACALLLYVRMRVGRDTRAQSLILMRVCLGRATGKECIEPVELQPGVCV